MPTSKGFVAIAPNPAIEKYQYGSKEAHKGAFSDEARVELAKAFHKEKDTVVMDGRVMVIKNFQDKAYVYVSPISGSGLPCGTFSYEKLEELYRDNTR